MDKGYKLFYEDLLVLLAISQDPRDDDDAGHCAAGHGLAGLVRQQHAAGGPGEFARQSAVLDGHIGGCRNAVSYTHLDVYKRQEF